MNLLKKFKGSLSDVSLVLIIMVYAFYFSRNYRGWTITGSALVIIAIIFWLIARYELGDAFSIHPQAKKIVKHGLYSKIRHPIYLFSVIAIFGLYIMYESWLLFFVLFGIITIQILRAKKEEKVLTKKFGSAYIQYKKQTWF